jgi:thiol-disulfide isomerase/thioredoxin
MNNIFKKIEKRFGKIFLGVLVFTLALFSGYYFLNTYNIETKNFAEEKNIEDDFVLPPQKGEKYLHFKEGNRLTVINYYSLDCPFCRKLFFEEKKFVQKYGDEVNFAFRDKPLSSNILSYEKAIIKECIYINNNNSDEKYFKYSEDIFANYQNSSDNAWARKVALKYIPSSVLENCLKDESLKQKIFGFRAAADASQIFWTPTIVLFKDGVEVERIEKVWPAIYQKVLDKYTNEI